MLKFQNRYGRIKTIRATESFDFYKALLPMYFINAVLVCAHLLRLQTFCTQIIFHTTNRQGVDYNTQIYNINNS